MSTAMTTTDAGSIMEAVITKGDLAKLTPEERTRYYATVCQSVGLNALTKPFEYITLNGKLTLYARKDATDQLRSLRSVSVVIVSRERLDDVYLVTARATTADGRTDESIGAVSIAKLGGDALANALMKAETKAKRRVTLSICGLGMLDETELETIPGATPVRQPEPPAPPVRQIAPAPPSVGEPLDLDEEFISPDAPITPELLSQVVDIVTAMSATYDSHKIQAWLERIIDGPLDGIGRDDIESTFTNANALKAIERYHNGRKEAR